MLSIYFQIYLGYFFYAVFSLYYLWALRLADAVNTICLYLLWTNMLTAASGKIYIGCYCKSDPSLDISCAWSQGHPARWCGDLVLIGRRGVVSDLDLLLFDVSIRAAVLRKLGSHRLISPTDHYRCVYNQAKMETKLHCWKRKCLQLTLINFEFLFSFMHILLFYLILGLLKFR